MLVRPRSSVRWAHSWRAAVLSAAIALAACGPAAPDRAPSSGDAPSAAEGCYLLALGPAVQPGARAAVLIPTALELRAGGQLAGAALVSDTLATVGGETGAAWERRAPDSVLVAWHPNWLGGFLYLGLVQRADTLRGRYEVHYHTVDDGRLLWRGDALALRTRCAGSSDGGRRLAAGAELDARERLLAGWRVAQRPDTAAAVAEGLRAFEDFLRRIPVHSLSLFNYRIAEYDCWRGRVPRTLDELRAAADTGGPVAALSALEERSWRDAWGRPLLYQSRGTHGYEVRSAGPDGAAGTADDLVGAYEEVPLRRARRDNCR
jgi:Type II secretion system (T2SS), protein G